MSQNPWMRYRDGAASRRGYSVFEKPRDPHADSEHQNFDRGRQYRLDHSRSHGIDTDIEYEDGGVSMDEMEFEQELFGERWRGDR